MSGRVIPAAVNWAALLKQTAPADRKLMAAFKLKSDAIAGNFVKASSFKRAIDWETYANSIDKEGLVAEFKAKAAADEIAVADYITKVDGQIDTASVTLNNLKSLPPFEQMTQADVLFFFPQLCRNQPSIWMSENCRTVTLLGAQHDDIQRQFHMPWTGEM